MDEHRHRGWLKERSWQSAGSLLHAAFLVLAWLSPSWRSGVFAWCPVVLWQAGGWEYPLGIAWLLPPASAFCWLVSIVRGGRSRRKCGSEVLLPVLGFIVLALLRLPGARDLRYALVAAVGITLFAWSFLCGSQLLRAGLVRGAIAVTLIVQSTTAILQFNAQDRIGLVWLNEKMVTADTPQASIIQAAGRTWVRAYGLAPHPNALGGFVAIMGLVALGATTASTGGRRWSWSLCVVLAASALFFSFSRAAWLGALGGLLYWLLVIRVWQRISRRALALLVIAAAVVALYLGYHYRDVLLARTLSADSVLETNSLMERQRNSTQALELIRSSPWLGVGSGQYIPELWARVEGDPPPDYQMVHSVALVAVAELGVGGGILWFVMLLLSAFTVLRAHGPHDPARVALPAAMVAAAIVSVWDVYLYPLATWWPSLYLGTLLGTWAAELPEGEQG